VSRRVLVVLGASSDQLHLIRTAQAMGLEVLAVDRNPAAPGLRLAEHALAESTRDVAAVAAHLDRERARGVRFAGVITMGSDIPDAVSALARHLGTPGVSEETARLATDKHAMKLRLAERGVPIPWFRELDSAADLERTVAERGHDLVVKPVDRSGSRGVFLLDPTVDLARVFAEARGESLCGRVQVEEFLRGLQISTETVLWRGRAVTPGFADRNYELLDRFRPRILENGGWVPSVLDAAARARVEATVEAAARALGITDGVAKGDVVWTDEGPKIVEIAARLSGGDFCESLVPLGTGVDYVRAAVSIAIGEDPRLDELRPRFERAVANRYLFPPPGRLLAVEGADEVAAKPWIEKLELWYERGDEVPPSLSHAHRFGVFVVSGPDRPTVQARVDEVYRTLVVRTTGAPAAGAA